MMRIQRWIGIGVGIFLLLLLGVSHVATRVQAQQANLAEAIKAVVRIRGCNVAGCNVGLGSGVIIHSSGVILTANHVTLTDPRNPLSPRLEDFIIEVTENARQSPQARYRARLLAAKPEADLALLGIYWDEAANQPLDDPGAVTLSNLPIADVNAINLGGRLHILGYPLAGGAAINYTEAALGGFDENGSLLKVNASLNEGYSGGPVLVEQDGRYAIAGVVILRRADVSFIRSIDQLNKLTWEPAARRVWADNVQVSVQESEANATIQISVEIHALDYVNRKGRVLAYMFDANTRQLWPSGDGNLQHSANGQMVLYQEFSATHMVDVLQPTILTFPLSQLNTQTDQVVFRLLLWDMDETRALWRGDQWHRPQQGTSEVAIAPTQSSTVTPSPTTMPTAIVTPTDTFKPTPTPTATSTETPPPTNTPTPSATNTTVPTPTTQIAAQEITGVVEVARLNFRQGPGRNFSPIGTVSSGETVTILSRNPAGDWWYVCCISGTTQEGWVSAQFIQPNFDLGQAGTLIPVDNTVTNISTPTQVSISIEPLSPSDGDSGSRQRTFTWSANFTPNDGYAFELVFWKPGEDPLKQSLGMAAATTDLSVILDLERLDEQLGGLFDIGEYNWGVLLVRTIPSYGRVQYLGGGRRFIYKRESNFDSDPPPSSRP